MRKLLLFSLPFGIGTLLCLYLVPGNWRILTAAAAVLTARLILPRLHGRRRRILRIGAAGLAAGIVWFTGYSSILLTPAEALAGTSGEVRVELLDYAEETGSGTRCKVQVVDPAVRGTAMYYGGSILLYLEPGDRVRAQAKYYSAAALAGEDSTYFPSQGIFLRLYGSQEQPITGGRAGSLRYLPQRLAKSLRDQIAEVFSPDASGFLTALLTGKRDGLDLRTSSHLSEAGLMHVTAVSGLHCGFLIAALGYLVFRRQRLTALLGYPVLLLYMVMVGCTPSVVRSCVMVGFVLLAPLLNREPDPLTSLSGALLVILLANPFAVASVSLQLSFAAAAGILLLSPKISPALQMFRRRFAWMPEQIWRFCAGTVSASLGVLVLTAPLNALYFGSLPLLSPAANLLVLWMVSPLFSITFLVTILSSLSSGVFLPLTAVPEWMARYILWVSHVLAGIPGHSVRFTGPAAVLWLLLVYAMLLLCILSKDRRRKYVVAGIAAAVCLAAARLLPVLTANGHELTAVAVNVGQGAATLLHSGGCTVLVDCGSLSGSGAGKAVAAAMETYGWSALDLIALTHYHADHANGLEELLVYVDAGELLVPQLASSDSQAALQRETLELAEQHHIPVSFVEIARETVDMGEAVLTVYPPLSEGDANEEGLTFLCSAGAFDLLITGDMGSATEQELIDTYLLPDIEVLIAGHHGSRYSNSKVLLDTVTPEVGIISAGANNPYGHPAAETVERMKRAGMTIFRTDLHGNILIRVHQT